MPSHKRPSVVMIGAVEQPKGKKHTRPVTISHTPTRDKLTCEHCGAVRAPVSDSDTVLLRHKIPRRSVWCEPSLMAYAAHREERRIAAGTISPVLTTYRQSV